MNTSALRWPRIGFVGRRLEWAAVPVGFGVGGLILRQCDHPLAAAIIAAVSIGVLVVWIVVQDLKTFTISDSALVTAIIVALAYRWSASVISGEPALAIAAATGLDALLPGGILLLFREVYYARRGFDGLGLGDVKLAAAGGLLVGTAGFSWALLAASLLAIGAVGLSRFCRTEKIVGNMDKIAFGALLAPAIWAVWMVEHAIILLPYADR